MTIASTAENPNTVRLEGDLDIYSAEDLRRALTDALRDRETLVLDLRGVEACDVAGLQMLVAARRTAQASGKTFRSEGPTDAIRSLCQATGIATEDL